MTRSAVVNLFSLLSVAVLGFYGASRLIADIRLPALIGDNMVLQHGSDAPLWGWADPGEKITLEAEWLDKPVSTTAAPDGRWSAGLPTPNCGGPYRLKIVGKNAIQFTDVLIGEVWICSGQSNMEWSINHGIDNGDAEAAAANYPFIRLFDVPNAVSLTPRADCDGRWLPCSPESVRSFSAIAYFFARELHRELGVPIGLIEADWGGTVAEAWVSEPTLRKLGDFNSTLDMIAREAKHPDDAERRYQERINHWWEQVARLDSGVAKQWMAPDLDDSDWPTHLVPAAWDNDELRDFDGVAWFRFAFDLPSNWENRDLTLSLGPIDDMDSVWLNGVKIGGLEVMDQWTTPRIYDVPAETLKSGRNLLAVRVIDAMGGGGICGQPEDVALRPRDADASTPLSLAGQWRYRRGVEMQDLPMWPRRLDNPNLPSVLSNGMIEPLIPFAIRGAIWYQGESNRPRAKQYQRLFPALIADWRHRWGRGDFPFYYVQIAPYRYGEDKGEAAELREAQLMTLGVPNTGMVVTMDIGNPDDIHPSNKQEVGRRLSLWALAKTYGRENLVYSGPVFKAMKTEGDKIRLTFNYAAGGLKTRDGAPPTCFTIAGPDRQFHAATAKIEGDTVVVSCPQVAAPLAVRYAWGAADQPNLCNQAGLPASSFRTDDWPRPGNTPY